jgi:hypothetical protein
LVCLSCDGKLIKAKSSFHDRLSRIPLTCIWVLDVAGSKWLTAKLLRYFFLLSVLHVNNIYLCIFQLFLLDFIFWLFFIFKMLLKCSRHIEGFMQGKRKYFLFLLLEFSCCKKFPVGFFVLYDDFCSKLHALK